MSTECGFNQKLLESRQITPPAEGGNGQIHVPGKYQNIVWQSRGRLPDSFEYALVATLEDLFEDGIDDLPKLVVGLNARQVFDRNGELWTEETFRDFLQVSGY